MTKVMAEPLLDDIDALKSLLIRTQQSLADTQQENYRLQQLIILYEEERRLAKARAFGPSSEQESNNIIYSMKPKAALMRLLRLTINRVFPLNHTAAEVGENNYQKIYRASTSFTI